MKYALGYDYAINVYNFSTTGSQHFEDEID